MRFRSKGQPKGQMLAREQRRLTLIFAGVGLIVLLISAFGRPASLKALLGESEAPAKKSPIVSDALMGSRDLLPDEIEFVRSEAPVAAKDYASMIDRSGALQMEKAAAISESGVADVPEKLTGLIRDDVIGVLSSETEAWFGTLRLAERIPSGPQYRIPQGQYALFMDAPQSCRGKAFTIRGRLRRLIKAPLPASAETFGVRSAFDAWISAPDSGSELIHVVALSADAGLPLTEHTGKNPPDVEVTGYFFKREGYAAKGADGRGDLALTPLILAGRIKYLPPQVVSTRADEMNPWLTWIGIAVCCGVLLIVWQFQIADKVFRGTRTHQLTAPPVRPSFEGVDAVSIHQVLREMEEYAQKSSPDTSLVSATTTRSNTPA